MLPGLVVSLVCLGIIAYLIDPAQLVQALQRADYRWVLGGVLVTFIWFIVRAAARFTPTPRPLAMLFSL
jgi:uncharacterized membrane protein YbhN (UPF0104 family)